jgi:N-acetylmuramoyl-L-alanine amidase
MIWTDIAEWRGPTPNHSGAMLEQRGVVVHIAEGSYEGTISWCKNPDSNVSCHFVVAADGRIAQVADTDVTVWTQIAGNGHWISVENEGHTPNPLTPAQVDANARILAKAHQVYGAPLQLAFDPTGRGLGHHSMGTDGHDNPTDTWTGPTWGHTDCPGPAIYSQKPAIVARAVELTEGGDMASADDTWTFIEAGTRPNKPDTFTPDGYDTMPNNWLGEHVAKAQQDAARAYATAQRVEAQCEQILAALAAIQPGTIELTPEQVAQISGAAHDGAAGAIDGAMVSSSVISVKKP